MVHLKAILSSITILSLAFIATARHIPPQRQSIAPDPSISTNPPQNPIPTPTAATIPNTAQATATASPTGSQTTGGTYTGDITHYDVGQGSCGTTNNDNEAVCALSVAMMANGPNPNTNPKCGKTITLVNPTTGSSTKATVVDTCQGCAFGDVDLSPSLFSTVAPQGDGRVAGIRWSFDS